MKSFKFVIQLVCFCFLSVKSQTVSYKYDLHGNRTQRVLGVSAANRASHNDTIMNQPYEPTMDLAMQYGVSIFPNPTNTNINITANKIPEETKTKVYLYDNTGRLLKQFDNIGPNTEVPLDGFSSGIYNIVIMVSEKDKLYYKVIKQD
jgi:hypothetical protein